MDPVIAKMLKEKEELQNRLKVIEGFLKLYDSFSEHYQGSGVIDPGIVRDAFATYESVHRETPLRPRAREISTRPTLRGPQMVINTARAILRDEGRPMTRGELADELQLRRVYLPGKDKESRARYVGTILWRRRDEDFEHIDGRGYWLKDVPVPKTEQEKRELRLEDQLI